tara:strand:- start:1 stop:444 length:444 start_codon:yes stop_codon:yes gene_type:complete
MSETHDLDLDTYMSEEELIDLKEELGEAYKEMAKFSEELCKKFKSCRANRIKLCLNLAKMYDFLAVGYAENKMTNLWFQACQAEVLLRSLANELVDEEYSVLKNHILSSNGGMYHFYMLFWEFKMAEPDWHPELEVVKGCIEKEVQA